MVFSAPTIVSIPPSSTAYINDTVTTTTNVNNETTVTHALTFGINKGVDGTNGATGLQGAKGDTGTVATAFAYYHNTNSTKQTFADRVFTNVLFPNVSRTIGTLGITQNAGRFTNSSGATIIVSASAFWSYASNSTGNRVFSLNHSQLGYLIYKNVTANSSFDTADSLSYTFSLLANESFSFDGWQLSGGGSLTTSALLGPPATWTITRLM